MEIEDKEGGGGLSDAAADSTAAVTKDKDSHKNATILLKALRHDVDMYNANDGAKYRCGPDNSNSRELESSSA
eukprot:CAMPEP_0119030508 /NCGR_PEP_ID=MMETSP1176-20130426/41067_1 /TAXON_ID=265551 /ORGANISM="Synedropsis recta cf, Strain CCMP1620" /LENGTH=72 /DNA_ID=CAMNT_0006986879 /DNA_START=876 /DNA_END=1093 /DNA_ORIENTATION=-